MGDCASPPDAESGLAYLFQTDDDIRLLIDWLRHHLPHSDKILHTLRCALTQFRSHLHLSIYADSLSHDTLTTVLIAYGRANAHTVAAQQPGKPQPAALHHYSPTINSPAQPSDACNLSFYTTRTSTARAMLQRYVDWTRELEFAGVQRCHRTLVDDMKRWYEAQHADEQAEVQLEYDPCHHWDYPFMVPPLSFGASPTNFSPARIARLPATIATGSLIASHWPYSSPSTASFIHALLLAASASSPSDGSYGAYRDEQLVAWEVKQPYGAIGMLYVQDSERRSGVARQLILRVIETALQERQQHLAAANDDGNNNGNQQQSTAETDGRLRVYDEFTPFCYTTETNVASKRLFETLGFESRFDIDWIVWKPTARQKQQKA